MASKNLWGSKFLYNGSTEVDTLGAVRVEFDPTDGVHKTYRFIQTASDTALHDGVCCAFVNGGTVVTSDISDASQGCPAGVAIGHVDSSSYGWIQIGGLHTSVYFPFNTGIAEAQTVILSAVDAQAATIAIAGSRTYKTLGEVAVGSGSLAVVLNCIDVTRI